MMVVCVNNKSEIRYNLTIGKVYEVFGDYMGPTSGKFFNSPYVFDDDGGAIEWYSLYKFKPLPDIREEKLNQIL